MKDAVDLIGKTLLIEETNYTIKTVYFIPDAVSNKHYLYFGLQNDNGCFINYSYYSLLPYIKEQIRL
jgi:hypothetical protein